MRRRYIKSLLSIVILSITVLAFVYYFQQHPEVGEQLSKTDPALLVLLLALYSLFSGSIAMILHASLIMCRAKLGRGESVLVTMYSSVINFFGPLQSGPAFRAAYLKKKHNVSLKNYGAATLLYYAAYALINVLFLLSGVLGWWTLLALLAGAVGVIVMIKGSGARFKKLHLRAVGYLVVATSIQIALVTLIFFLELKSIDSAITINQAIIYSGAANLALFVSITPGAIGFRESFLYLSQKMHNIDTPTIVSANILDRSIYISLLLIFAIYIFTTHTRKTLKKAIS